MLSDLGCIVTLVHLDEVMPHWNLTPTLEATLEQFRQYSRHYTFERFADGDRFMCELEGRADKQRDKKQLKPKKTSVSTSIANAANVKSSSTSNPPPATPKYLVRLPSESPPTTPSSAATNDPTKCGSNGSSSAIPYRSTVPPPGPSQSVHKKTPSPPKKKSISTGEKETLSHPSSSSTRTVVIANNNGNYSSSSAPIGMRTKKPSQPTTAILKIALPLPMMVDKATQFETLPVRRYFLFSTSLLT